MVFFFSKNKKRRIFIQTYITIVSCMISYKNKYDQIWKRSPRETTLEIKRTIIQDGGNAGGKRSNGILVDSIR